jgi:hypothetical protein
MPRPVEPRAGTIQDIHDAVSELRIALRSPSPAGLADSIPRLEQAAARLRSIKTPVTAAMKSELADLQRDLIHAAKLLEHGSAYQQSWAGLLGSAMGGYTVEGTPGQLTVSASLSISG